MEEGARPGRRDMLVPAGLVVLGTTELAWLGSDGWVLAAALEALAGVALVFRRTHTWLAAPAAALLLMLMPWTGTAMDAAATPIFFYVLGMYSLGRYLPWLGAVLVALATLGVVAVDFATSPGSPDPTDAVFVLALAVPPFAFGRIGQRLADQTRLLAEQGEQLRDAAVREERDRIAREMHDVIAHSISAMVVQTAAAQDLLRTQPDRAALLLERVADAGRQALAETGRLLHLVRDDADELGLRPAPGLGDLPELVASSRRGGLTLDAELRLPDRPLPGVVDVTAYRVVQEALTNAQRHGKGPVRLEVTAEGDRVVIRCSNAVNGTRRPGSGLGLQGMAERVALVGGTLRREAGEDRFEVEVELPVLETAP
ncbi:sensor histidine kinase [Nocardioides coralli]|uniref:sensor histidine kinase n=1 Tax=Nocardioides coralli TaxID=2872154 RepID=UPI001CA4413B|nr:histidine kinase [Nocardioides coralli]QZY29658.1 hypothetical protein K6T13_02900 [Nocardioides coralli]